MGKYFGTDGIRAVAGEFPLVDEFITKLGYAALDELKKTPQAAQLKPQVIIAQDSRASGPKILAALEKGIRASGVNVISIGISTTPSVAYLVKQTGSLCGIVISASHNPAEFNGIKFFTNSGTKLPEALENAIEARIENTTSVPEPTGTYREDTSLVKQYEQFLKSTVDADLLKGTKIVLDCANGASYQIAANVFADLGMRVTVTGAKPDGTNINKDIGALHTGFMQRLTVRERAFMGFSFDGDADRVMAVDSKGRCIPGDKLVCMFAEFLKKDKIVTTVDASMNVEGACKTVLRCPVGDNNVSEMMMQNKLSFGGETSGAWVFQETSLCPDGIYGAALLLKMASTRDMAEWADSYPSYPLIRSSIKGVFDMDKIGTLLKKNFKDAEISDVDGLRFALKDSWFLVRKSGTEPKLRFTVEAKDDETARSLHAKLMEILGELK